MYQILVNKLDDAVELKRDQELKEIDATSTSLKYSD